MSRFGGADACDCNRDREARGSSTALRRGAGLVVGVPEGPGFGDATAGGLVVDDVGVGDVEDDGAALEGVGLAEGSFVGAGEASWRGGAADGAGEL